MLKMAPGEYFFFFGISFCELLFFRYRVTILVLTFFAYTTYHLSRKPISVVKVNLFRWSLSDRVCMGLMSHPNKGVLTARLLWAF